LAVTAIIAAVVVLDASFCEAANASESLFTFV